MSGGLCAVSEQQNQAAHRLSVIRSLFLAFTGMDVARYESCAKNG